MLDATDHWDEGGLGGGCGVEPIGEEGEDGCRVCGIADADATEDVSDLLAADEGAILVHEVLADEGTKHAVWAVRMHWI